MSDEEKFINAGLGKWGQAGVPKKGWRCVGVEDLGEPDAVCEMCERITIRHVHEMEHDNYPDVLRVGCVCAGHMEEDLVAARRRDTEMKSRAGKRKRWLTRKWKVSGKGNNWISADGFRVTIMRKGSGFAAAVARVAQPGDGIVLDAAGRPVFDANGMMMRVKAKDDVRYSRRTYPTSDEAKLAAFDVITDLLSGKAR